MEIGIVYPQTELRGDPEAVRQIGLATEELGYDYLLAYDHVVGAAHADRDPELWGPYTENDPFHDPFVLFAYLAGMTSRIGFATGVLILPQRQTVLVAKQAADLDLMSGGRLRLGVGTGWNYVEYDALGLPFDKRGPIFDEQIPYLRELWSKDLITYKGDFHSIERGTLIPRPNRQIPIWLGGFSSVAFRRAAQVGDGFMFAGDYERCTDGWSQIESAAEKAGRDLTGFGREIITLRAKTVDTCVETIERWRESGGTHVAVCTMGMGLDSIEGHLDFMSSVQQRLDT